MPLERLVEENLNATAKVGEESPVATAKVSKETLGAIGEACSSDCRGLSNLWLPKAKTPAPWNKICHIDKISTGPKKNDMENKNDTV